MPGPSRARVFRILHLEDSELDHELLVAHLARGGLNAQTRRIDSESAFLEALDEPWDAVVSDYNLPGFSGLVALELLKASKREIPFILVSGEIGDDTAVEAMRNGASDYLQKSHLARLVPALMHAIDAAETRRARVRADRDLVASKQRLHELAQHLQTSVEHERAAIAREIHDDVGGSLTGAEVRPRLDRAPFELAADRLARPVGARDGDARGRVEPADHAQPAPGDPRAGPGRGAALDRAALRAQERRRVPDPAAQAAARAAARRAAGRLPDAQEALTNISKHAQATRVQIDLSLAGGVLSLEISDNGRGVSEEDLAKSRSFGIRGLHERATTVGGWIDLSSGPHGTTLILSVPLDSPTAPTCPSLRQVVRPQPVGRRVNMVPPRSLRSLPPAGARPAWGGPAPGRHARESLSMIKVFLCDDHALIRRGIRDTLSDAPDIEVVGEAGDYGELRALMREKSADVLVLDINLPGRSGLDVLHALKDEGTAMRVLVVSMYPEDQYAIRALRAGAFGYVNKGGDPALIVSAVRTVSQGRKYVTPEIAQMLVESLTTPSVENAHDKLSDREMQTLVMIASGKRLSDIAEELMLSPKTVSVYRARVLEKLGLANNSEMTVYAIRQGLVGN
jgi:DNA-binding NarL/FixJ family response regulator